MVTESLGVSLVGGTCSGVICTVLFQPLDFLKTQLQLASGASRVNGTVLRTLPGNVVRTCWVGLRPSLARTIPGVACYFATLSQLKKLHGGELNNVSAMGLGALARTLTVIGVQPLTLVKTRYESGQFGYRSISGAFRDIVVRERAVGLYRGLLATILRDAPFSGLYLALYSQLKRNFYDPESTVSTVVSGLAAGCGAALLTHPADVIKTRVQTTTAEKGATLSKTAMIVYKEGGIRAFYAGFVPRVVRRTLVSCTAWLIYEEVKKRSYLFS